MKTPEGNPSNFVFKNEPKLSEHEVDKTYNERRLALMPLIENFITNHHLFAGQEISVEFSHEGVSSLVCFIETSEDKKVLKIPLDANPHEGEAQFLEVWEEAGVSTPRISEEGALGGHPYILMDFVDAPVLSDLIKQGLAREGVSVEMGKMLRTMHTVKAKGYGRIVDGKPQHEQFRDWLLSADVRNRIKTVEDNKLLTDEHGSISQVRKILIRYCEWDEASTYCHFDFGSDNILATEPLTVIDPDPMLNNGIIDLGKSLFLGASGGGSSEAIDQWKKGYFGEGKNFDAQALQASILLAAYMKFPWWHKHNKTRLMDNARRYLAQTSHNLR